MTCIHGQTANDLVLQQKIDQHPTWFNSHVLSLQTSTYFNRRIPLSLVVIDRSGWSLATTIKEIRVVEQVFSQCSVSFSPITIVQSSTTMVAPYDYDGSDHLYFENSPLKSRPLIVVDYDSSLPQKRNRGGYAHIPSRTYEHFLKGTGFVFQRGVKRQRDMEYLRGLSINTVPQIKGEIHNSTPKFYSILSHEIAHILFDHGHVKEPYNILYLKMPEFSQLGHHITDEQCDSIDESFFK